MSTFSGNAQPSDSAYLNETRELRGPHLVLYPISLEDVKHVVAAANELDIKVRSGSQTTVEDEQDVPDGIALDLSDLDSAEMRGDLLVADAGAKNHRLAEVLGDRIIPLSDNPLRSVASDLLKDNDGPLTKSLGPLSSYVEKLTVVDRNAADFEIIAAQESEWRSRVLEERLIVTQVVFKTASTESLWMLRTSMPHPSPDMHQRLTEGMFTPKAAKDRGYLSMRSHRGPMPDVSMLTVINVGQTEAQKRRATEEISADIDSMRSLAAGTDLDKLPTEALVKSLTLEFYGGDVYSALLDVGQSAARDPAVATRRQVKTVQAAEQGAEAVEGYLASSEQVSAAIDRPVQVDIRIESGSDGSLKVSQLDYELLAKAPSAASRTTGASAEQHYSQIDETTELQAEALAELRQRFGLAARGTRIKGFKGAVYTASDPGYVKKTQQYANLFRPGKQTSPWLMCEPMDEADIVVAIQYAAAKGKAVVVRSGGHQYSALSSGGDETLVILMDRFGGLNIDPESGIVGVGAAARLSKFSAELKENRLTLPYGECPEVAVGGHVQTGGYGHIGRSLGPLVDRVQSFRIVLASGEARTVHRPAAGTPAENDELFRAVLGGNPGSFGVICGYQFLAIKSDESEASASYGISREFSLPLADAVLDQLRQWAERVEAGTLPPGWDFTITFLSAGGRIPGALINTKVSHVRDAAMGDEVDPQTRQAVEEYLTLMRDTPPQSVLDFFLWMKHQGVSTANQTPLYEMSDSFVRRFPQTSWRGREYDLPYQKRLNSSYKAVNTDFLKRLARLLDSVIGQGYYSDLKAVTQIWIGGGKFLDEKGMAESALPHRRAVSTFTFDIFHQPNPESERKARALQQEMQQAVEEHFTEQECRMFWCTFGDAGSDELNMSNAETQRQYYDNCADFERLQDVKRVVDPDNVFRTSFTIPV